MLRSFFALVLMTGSACAAQHTTGEPVDQGPKNVPEFEPAFENQTRAPAIANPGSLATQEIATGLAHPWGIAVMPDGGYLVTEREGRLRVIGPDGELRQASVAGMPQVVNRRQGGLLDVEVADDFAQSRRIFFTYAKPMSGNRNATAAATGVLNEDMTEISSVQDIFVQDPPSPNPMHFGSRIVLDGEHAYVTTGEHFTQEERVYAQDLDKTYGKIVRVTLSGDVPSDNPFVGDETAIPTIYSYGHRNIQGADINPATGELWGLEHGPAGGDELNLIEAGANYGWPVVSYGRNYGGPLVGSGQPRAEGMTEPRYYWDPVIAPGGFVFYEGDMFDWQGDVLASSLNPGGLVRLTLDGDTVTGEARYLPDVGRVRDVAIDRDGALLLLIDADSGSVLRVTPQG